MRNVMGIKILLVGATLTMGLCAWGQARRIIGQPQSSIEVAVTYDAMHSNTVSKQTFWLQGGGVQLAGQFTSHWAAVADVSGEHSGQMPGSLSGLDIVTAVFGPRYSQTLHGGKFRLYGVALGGVANGVNGIFPSPQGANSIASGSAMLLGGGADYLLQRHIAIRAVEAGWMRTALSDGTTSVQNNLRLGSGLVFHF